MSERKLPLAGHLAVLAICAWSAGAAALELGFEGQLAVENSDNVAGVNSPDEKSGITAAAVLGVYGEQRSRRFEAAFRGELDSRKLVSEDGSSVNTISRFLGAAEFNITPRSWRWYVGDVLGGVRSDNGVQTIDDTTIDRRNVFVTGPSFQYDIRGVSRTRARLLYVNQTEESEQLETLYTGTFSYEHDTIPGSFVGFRLGDVYTDVVESADRNGSDTAASDFNRSTVAVFMNRERGWLSLYGELGATRYDTDDESVDGVNAQLRAIRAIGPQTTLTATLTRDLNDQNLSTVESLIGGDGIGLRPDISGFFSETRLTLAYSFQSNMTSLDLGVSLAELDYQLLATDTSFTFDADGEDHRQATAFANVSHRVNSRLRGEMGVSYERQEYDNRADETDSVLASTKLVYRLSNSFELEAGLVHDAASGLLTRFSTGTGVEENVDVTENQVILGIRWAPPSRANQDLTVELKSLLR